jgi:hypothetical protein
MRQFGATFNQSFGWHLAKKNPHTMQRDFSWILPQTLFFTGYAKPNICVESYQKRMKFNIWVGRTYKMSPRQNVSIQNVYTQRLLK